MSKITFQVTSWLLGFLLAGNIFFVKRLVDNQDLQGVKQDKQNEVVWQLRQDVAILKISFDLISKTKLKGE